MTRISLNTAVGFVVALCGFACLFMLALSTFALALTSADNSSDIVFIIVLLPVAIPGLLAAYNGVALFRAATKAHIKATVGTLAIFGVIFLYPISISPDTLGEMLYVFPATLIAIAFYVRFSKLLMSKAGLAPRKGEFIARWIFLLISFLIFFTGSELGRPYIRQTLDESGDGLLAFTYLYLVTLGPLLATLMFFVVSVRVVNKRNAPPADPPVAEVEAAPV